MTEALTGIKARLGSIAPSKLNEMPRSVQRLLERDVPRLVGALSVIAEEHECCYGCGICEALSVIQGD